MIYLSYGMPKSASTFCYQITEALLRQSGHIREEICKQYLPEKYHQAFMVIKDEEIIEINQCVPPDKILIIKTHSELCESVDRLLKSGELNASATYRDPRDAAYSLIDAGKKDRNKNLNRTFSDIYDLDQAFYYLKGYQHNLLTWLSHPNVLKIGYDLLAINPIEAAKRICSQLNIAVDVAPIVEKFSANLKKTVWEFNIGKIDRHKDCMSDEDNQKFCLEFENLIELMNELDASV